MSTKGVDWKNASFIIGMRADLVAEPQRQKAFAKDCENCKTRTYIETEHPLDVPVICNICASRISAQIEQDPSTLLLYDMPNDVKARLIDIAQQQRLPIDDVLKGFVEWKLGRPTKAGLYNNPKKDHEQE
jgi:hypothetical protein